MIGSRYPSPELLNVNVKNRQLRDHSLIEIKVLTLIRHKREFFRRTPEHKEKS